MAAISTPVATPGANEVVLRDGSTVHIRATDPSDGPLIAELIDGLSRESRWLRFLGTVNARPAGELLAQHGVGLVALAGSVYAALSPVAARRDRGPGGRRGRRAAGRQRRHVRARRLPLVKASVRHERRPPETAAPGQPSEPAA